MDASGRKLLLFVFATWASLFLAEGRIGLPSDFLAQKPDQSATAAHLLEQRPILQQSIVDTVNKHGKSTWKAGHNSRFEKMSVKDFKRLCGSLPMPSSALETDGEVIQVVSRVGNSKVKLPDSFDAREAWPRCKSIGTILDQGHCGSCWAFGAVESLSDRFCIQGFENVSLSENDLLACCGFECGYGCDGGYPYRAWQYFRRKGVVSQTCDPYFDTAGCGHPGCSPLYETPTCFKSCVNDDLWTESKHFATSAYFVSSDPEELKLELYTNGPYEVTFDVFEDFAHYKSGVYQFTTGEYLGGHAVKLVGWGTTDEGVDFWTIANSWNRGFGEDGYFRILRGTNECGIESEATAGIPYLRGRLQQS